MVQSVGLRKIILGTGYSTPGAEEIFWRITWLCISTLLIAYASYLYFGSVTFGAGEAKPVRIVDLVKEGKHHLSGTLFVPTPCHTLAVRTEEVAPDAYRLVFTTWQESTRWCPKSEVGRGFNTVVFAKPSGVTFTATVDGNDMPLEIATHR